MSKHTFKTIIEFSFYHNNDFDEIDIKEASEKLCRWIEYNACKNINILQCSIDDNGEIKPYIQGVSYDNLPS